MPVCSITRIEPRPGHAKTVRRMSNGIAKQMARSSGFLEGRMMIDKGALWTMSLWSDEASMTGFRDTGVHRDAMPETKRLIARFDTVRCLQRSLPSWRDASSLMADAHGEETAAKRTWLSRGVKRA